MSGTSSVGIVSLTNAQDGVTALAVITGRPVGTLEFWASEMAAGPEFPVPFTKNNDGTFSLTLPYADVWYVWAKDANGYGSQRAAVFLASGTDNPDIDALGLYLRDLLEANKGGFDAFAQTWFPGTTIKQFHYGFASGILESPSVSVINPHFDWDWFATGFVQRWNYSFTVAFVVIHPDEESMTPLATRLADAALHLLNRRRCNTFALDSGLKPFEVQLRRGESAELELPENAGFAASATCVWSCSALKQIGSGLSAQG